MVRKYELEIFLILTEHLTKAVQLWNNHSTNIAIKIVSDIDVYILNKSGKWLENKMQQFYNSIFNTIATNEERKRNSALPSFSENNNLAEFTKTSKVSCW